MEVGKEQKICWVADTSGSTGSFLPPSLIQPFMSRWSGFGLQHTKSLLVKWSRVPVSGQLQSLARGSGFNSHTLRYLASLGCKLRYPAQLG